MVLAGVRLCWMRSCQTLLASRWHFCADGGKKRVERSLVEPGESGALTGSNSHMPGLL